ncbi:phage tail protein (plasmid) [Microtetraspora malaysiensis]|uniref:phage tail protein n=1 Tax=Microtetraspora malaysiensis TaxID=161358 RepID=UPI003D921E2E
MALHVGELFATIDLRDRLSMALRKAMNNLKDSAGSFSSHVGSMAASATAMGAKFTAVALAASTLASALAVSAQGVIALAASLAPAGGIVAALPGVLTLGAAALGTFKLAVSGVGDAFAAAMSGDLDEFFKKSEGMAAAVGSVAFELFQMSPAFLGLKDSVQSAMFTPLIGQMWSLLPLIVTLRDGMASVAAEFGQGALKLVEFGRSSETVAAVASIFGSLRSAVESMLPAIQPLLAGFRDIAVVGGEFSAGLAPGIASATARFGEWLSKAAESGQAMSWMQGAMDVFRQLGSLVANLVGIIGGIFTAVRTGGSDALGVLGTLVGKFNEFVNSAKGQEILVTIFQSLQQVGNALFPIFEALGGAIALIAPHIANIATALGPGLAAAVNALGPALAALGPGLTLVAEMLSKAFASPELAAGLLAIGKGFSDILTAVAPLLPPIAQLAGMLASTLAPILAQIVQVVAEALKPVLTALGPVIETMGAAFGQLVAALMPLLPPIAQLVTQLATALLPIVGPLVGIVAELASTLGGFLVQALQLVLQAIAPILPVLGEVVVAIGTALMQALQQMMPSLLKLLDALLLLLPAIMPLIPALGEVVVAIMPLIGIVVDLVATIASKLIPIIAEVIGWIVKLAAFIIEHIAKALGWLVDHLSGLASDFKEWFGKAADAATQVFNDLVAWVRDLPGRILNSLGNLGNLLYNAGRDLLYGLWNGLMSVANWLRDSVLNFFRSVLPDWVRSALNINSPSKVFAEIGRYTMLGMREGLLDGTPQVLSTMAGIAGQLSQSFAPDLSVPGMTVPDKLAGGGWARTVVNVTNHYPVAEPTSTTVNRSLQYTGALGVI